MWSWSIRRQTSVEAPTKHWSTVNQHVGHMLVESWSSIDRYIDRCLWHLKDTWSHNSFHLRWWVDDLWVAFGVGSLPCLEGIFSRESCFVLLIAKKKILHQTHQQQISLVLVSLCLKLTEAWKWLSGRRWYPWQPFNQPQPMVPTSLNIVNKMTILW